MSTHIIEERGEGFPEVDELVYEPIENTIYRVKSIDSNILTRQYQANYIYATLEFEGNAEDLTDQQFEDLRQLTIHSEAV